VIDSCTFAQFNLKLVEFNSVFQSIEVDFINDLSKYNLIPAKKINRDIKKLLYHHIFYGISEYILHHPTKERIIILKKNDIPEDLLSFQYFSKTDIQKYINQITFKVAKLLPISIYSYDNLNFNHIEVEYKERRGNVIELIEKIRMFSWGHNATRSVYTFARVKDFAKRNGLTFLSERYFNQLKIKQLLLY
jgi:hypothetical protein